MSDDFSLEALCWLSKTNNVDLRFDVNDDHLCRAILGVDQARLSDLAEVLVKTHGVYGDEKHIEGPPKWHYNKFSLYDSFDYYAREGCPNCGTAFSFAFRHDYPLLKAKALMCKACGHRPCPLHFGNESDNLVHDRESPNFKDAVYIRGTRSYHDFGENGKGWWQSYFLSEGYRESEFNKSMAGQDLLASGKGETVKEVCELCGHDTAYFTTFQARSADEGLTIMYECVKCRHRRTFNN